MLRGRRNTAPALLRGRPGIDSLPLPPKRYDPARRAGFETEGRCAREDSNRTRQLRREASRNPIDRQCLLRLAECIDPDLTDSPDTLASSRCIRGLRRRIVGALWQLLDDQATSVTSTAGRPDPCLFHAMMDGSTVLLGQSDSFDPEAHLQRFRGHLYRAAREQLGGMPPGMLFAAVHGAYDPNTRTFPMHIHGVATGGKISAINALRTLRTYQPAVAGDGRDAARTPILMSRQPIHDLPGALGYTFKSFWPLRPTVMVSDGLRLALRVPTMRIRDEPAASEYLRFLDRWDVNQISLLMGMRASRTGFVRL